MNWYDNANKMPNAGWPMTAAANVRGSYAYPGIAGTVCFTQTAQGVVVNADIAGLPLTTAGFFGFHIHAGHCGSPQPPTPFADADGHYNPQGQPHPRHAGDLPVLQETSRGMAQLRFVTDRFRLADVIGRAVVIHLQPNDYRSQPSGDAGEMIACGDIVAGAQVAPMPLPTPVPGYQLPGMVNG